MNKIKTLLAAGAAATLAFTGAAMAQGCVDIESGQESLRSSLGQTLQMSGDITSISAQDLDFNLYANETTGTWTLASVGRGSLCLQALGEGYQEPDAENGPVAYGVLGDGSLVRLFNDPSTDMWTIDTARTVTEIGTPYVSGTGFQEVGIQAPKP